MKLRKALRRLGERLTLRQLYRGKGLSIQALPGQGETGIVVFASLHGSLMDERSIEMAGTATAGNRPAVFVRDLAQGWYQDAGNAALIREIVPQYMAQIGVKRIMAVGGSMGAYAAMAFARDIGARTALAFGPQYEVSLDGMADDPRWPEYRGRIAEHALGPLDRWLSPDVDYFALHGREGADIVHWTRFPVQDNLHHYLIDQRWHDVPQWLKEQNKLRTCFELAVAGDRDGFHAVMDEVGGQRRHAGMTFETDPNTWLLRESPMAREGRLPPPLQARAQAL